MKKRYVDHCLQSFIQCHITENMPVYDSIVDAIQFMVKIVIDIYAVCFDGYLIVLLFPKRSKKLWG